MRAKPSETQPVTPLQQPAGEFDAADELSRLWQAGQTPDLAEYVMRAGVLSPAELAAVVCVDQRARWSRGERVLAEQYLADYPRLQDDPESSADIIYAELLLREQQGQDATTEEFVARFPAQADLLRQQIGLHLALCKPPLADTVADRPNRRGLLEANSDFSNYEIVREIGRGGSGVVYEARQAGVNRTVALKVLSAGPHAGSDQYLRFCAEAELVGRLQHPNIVQVYDAGDYEGCPFLAMEFVAAGSLRERLNGAPQPPASSAQLVETLARAIHAAHLAGIVHRDLKPGNILFTRNSELEEGSDRTAAAWPVAAIPKIGDFGLAKSLYEGDGDSPGGPLTRTGDILGTPSYMSPEQAGGLAQVGPATDIYALGAILYELVTGRPPFQGVTALETLQQVVAVDPVSPSRLQPRLPRDLGVICLKCLEKQSAQRYATALDLADDLQRYLTDRPIVARPTPRWAHLARWCRRNPAPATLAGLVIVLVTALVLGSLAATVRLGEAAQARLAEVRLAEARAVRLSDRLGRRAASWSLLGEAARIGPGPEIRNEAIAGMALFDLPVAGLGPEFSRLHYTLDFDGQLARYTRADRAGQITIHRVEDDAEICRIPKAIPEALLLMSADGRYLATRFAHGSDVEVWSVDDSSPRLALAESCCSTYGFGAFDFSRDGALLAVGRPDGTVVVRSLPPGDFHREWQLDSLSYRVAFHPLQPQIAIVTMAAIEVRNYRSGRLLVRLENSAGTSWVAWHPEGLLLATADANQSISLWQPPDFRRARTLPGHDGGGTQLRFNSSGTMLASHAWDNVLQFWDPSDGRLLFKCRTANVPMLKCASDRDLWAGDATLGRVQFWQADVKEVYRRLFSDFGRAGELYIHLAVSPQSIGRGRLLAVAMEDSVRFWDLRSRREIGRLPVHSIMRVRFEPSGALLTNCIAGILRWPIQESADVPGELIVGPPAIVWASGTNGDLAGTPDGRTVAVGGNSGAFVISPDQPDSRRNLRGHADPRYVDLSRDGRWVATGSHNGTNVNVWDAKTGTLVRELPVGASHVAFSPDGTWLATTGDGLTLWSVGDWSPVWQGAGQNFSAHAFTPDGRFIAVESGTGAIVLYDMPTGREVARLTDPYGRRQAWMAFSPDARFLAAIPYDFKGLALWNLGEVEDRLEQLGAGGQRVSATDTAGDTLDADPLTLTARVEDSAQRLEKALEDVTEQVRQNPADPALRSRRGQILGELNRPEEAIREFTLAIDIAESDLLYDLRCRVHAAANNYREAIADADRVLATVTPHDAREVHACNQLAWFCLIGPVETRQPERALALARRALRRAPDRAECLNTLGVAHCRRAEWDDAVDALRRSLRAGGSAPAYDWYFLALAWNNLGNERLAADLFDQAVYWHATHEPLLDPMSQRELSGIRQEVEDQLYPAQSAGDDARPAPGALK